jgi:hypothetical protein
VLIKQCTSYPQLQEVVQQQGQSFNYIHAAAALTHAAQLAQNILQQQQQQQRSCSRFPAYYQQTQLQQQTTFGSQGQQQLALPAELMSTLPALLQHAQQQCSSFQGRQVANCLWAAQRLLHVVELQLMQTGVQVKQQQQQGIELQQLQLQLLELIQQLQQQAEFCWHLFNGQELVLLLYSTANFTAAASVQTALTAAAAAGDNLYGTAEDTEANTSNQTDDRLDRRINSSRSSSIIAEEGAPAAPAAASAAGTAGDFAAVNFAWISKAVQQLQRLHRKHRLRLKPQEFEMLLISLRRLLAQQQQQQQQALDMQGQELEQQQQPWDEQGTQQQRQFPSKYSSSFDLPVQLLQQQLVLVLQQPERCSCRDVAGILYSYTVLGLSSSSSSLMMFASCSSLQRLAASLSFKALRCSCNPADITNLLYGLAMLRQQQQQQQQQRIRSANPSSSSSSSGHLAGQSPEWWIALFKGFCRQLRQFTAGELVACLYAFARLGVRPQQLLAAAVPLAAAQLQPSQQQEMVLLLWSVGALQYKPPAVVLAGIVAKYLKGAAALPDIAADGADSQQQQQQQQQVVSQAAQHVSMVLWACGRLGYCPPAVQLQLLLQHSQQLLPASSPQQLACITYGLGSLGVRPISSWLNSSHLRLLELLVEPSGPSQAGSQGLAADSSAKPRLRMTGQGLAMVLWGLARMQVPVQTADACAAAAASKGNASLADVAAASEQLLLAWPEVAGVVLWGFVRLGHKPEPQLVCSVLQSFLQGRQQQHKQRQQQQGRHQQQQQQDRIQQQQGPRLAHSLSLTAWVLTQLDPSEEETQLLQQALRNNTQLVRRASDLLSFSTNFLLCVFVTSGSCTATGCLANACVVFVHIFCAVVCSCLSRLEPAACVCASLQQCSLRGLSSLTLDVLQVPLLVHISLAATAAAAAACHAHSCVTATPQT